MAARRTARSRQAAEIWGDTSPVFNTAGPPIEARAEAVPAVMSRFAACVLEPRMRDIERLPIRGGSPMPRLGSPTCQSHSDE
jgi:hypothetical protein